MPWKPKHRCIFPGCTILIESGLSYCPEHDARIESQRDQSRGTSTQRGYNAQWRRLRQWWLNAHPLCEECKKHGILTSATLVDHIIPHHGDSNLLYDPANLQSLCTPCHNRKTATEDGGLGNARMNGQLQPQPQLQPLTPTFNGDLT